MAKVLLPLRKLAVGLLVLSHVGCGRSESEGGTAGAADVPEHSCIVLPGSWSNATRSFAIGSGPEVGQLAYVSEAKDGVWHQRAAIHPTGRFLYVSVSILDADSANAGIVALAYQFDAATCAIGPLVDSATAGTEAPSGLMRYYGLEMHPNGRYLYQTTEAVQDLRFHRVSDDGTLTLIESHDVTQDGRHVCAHTRRLAMHPSGRTLYSNCNNNEAGEEVDYAIQAWRVESDGRLTFLEHYSTPGMDAGIFDPTVHPNGRWLYQPLSSGKASAPAGEGAYILLYDIDPSGRLRYRSAVRVPDSDADSVGNTRDLPWTALPSTVLIHPDGTHAYVTLHDQVNFTHHILVYRIDQQDGALSDLSTINTVTTGTGSHHGGVLARREGRMFLYTFVNAWPGPEGFIEQYEVAGDYRLLPLDPVRIRAGLVDGRHAVAVRRVR